MPFVKLSLPLHVVARPRKDGTFNVLFRVRRDRPHSWPSTITLPLTGRRTGDLTNADELARIVADVEGPDGLLARLATARLVTPETAPGTVAWLAERWTGARPEDRDCNHPPDGASGEWKELKFRTRSFYISSLRQIEAWVGLPPLAKLTLPQLLRCLDLYNDRPAQKAALKRTLSAMFSYALRIGAMTVHPFGVTLRLRRPRNAQRRAVERWDAKSVNVYADAAEASGWLGGAILIRLMWETSADASDCVTWTRGEHFIDDATRPAIAYARGKTDEGGQVVGTPISHKLADMIRRNGAFVLVTDPDGRPYEATVESDNQRGYHLRRLKKRVVADGGPALLYDHLRHSALTDAVETGATLTQTKALSRHRTTAMLETVYVQFTDAQIEAVQRGRGLIE